MKSSTLRICVLALGLALFAVQPAMAACGYLCDFFNCNREPTHPEWGCHQQVGSCLDYWCSPSATFDPEVIANLAAAAQAGDTATVTLLATAIGQPIRLYAEGKLVHDGFALAGVRGPGPGATSADRLAACGSAAPAPAEPAAEKAETAKKADDAP